MAAPAELDPAAVVAASRRPGEPWFVLEQPARDAAAIAALGCVLELEDRGVGRFDRLATRWRALAGAAVCGPADGPRGSGLIATGGFAFADEGGTDAGVGGLRAARRCSSRSSRSRGAATTCA
ncbi:hypothetical protein LRS13_16360 [Svornostia abyssi]|uniref:Uncharacterized protein n=1 Tax=Svornostia abyssi TaxID=2898438 RepID=A0ABY5PCK8_9ACTN|nr:hypothetical protein LRS13_16360 [Parviterribacteraceae bacterium J379]